MGCIAVKRERNEESLLLQKQVSEEVEAIGGDRRAG